MLFGFVMHMEVVHICLPPLCFFLTISPLLTIFNDHYNNAVFLMVYKSLGSMLFEFILICHVVPLLIAGTVSSTVSAVHTFY